MADAYPGADDVYIATRRQLHGVVEILIAGPQYRTAGTIRLALRTDGFAGAVLPVAVAGTRLVWPQGSADVAGPLNRIVAAAGLHAGPPTGIYSSAQPLDTDATLDIDPAAATLVEGSHHLGAGALKTLAPHCEPVLWPEHFDTSITVDGVNLGVSPGDSCHPVPYAYIGPSALRTGPFWNASFGALRPLLPSDGVADVADFFEQGRHQAAVDPITKEHAT